MAKPSPHNAQLVAGLATGDDRASPEQRIVRFGDVVVSGPQPPEEALRRSVETSSAALERALIRLRKPGVRLPAKKGVPRYSVADGETDIFVRKLDGRKDRGRFENGQFRVID